MLVNHLVQFFETINQKHNLSREWRWQGLPCWWGCLFVYHASQGAATVLATQTYAATPTHWPIFLQCDLIS